MSGSGLSCSSRQYDMWYRMAIHRNWAITASKSYHNLSSSAIEFKKLHAQKLKWKPDRSDAAAWDHLIRAYCNHPSSSKLPFQVYKQMHSRGIKPTQFTFPPLLKSLASCAALSEAMQIHSRVFASCLIGNVFVVHSLIGAYARSALMESARRLFDEMSSRNCVSWNVMISSYCQNGLFKEALELFQRMPILGFGYDRVTIVSILPACAHLGAIGVGEWIHGKARESGCVKCVFLGTALIDMYCKCGFVEKAKEVFDEMPEKNIVTWNSMIGGFAMNGHSNRAFDLFNILTMSPILPNYVTFIARAGQLVEALDLVEAMPFEPDAVIWGALLGACRIHNNVELGVRVMGHLFELEPRNCGNYMILSNMYADTGRWEDASGVATKMKKCGIRKTPGCSWIEVDFEVHQFFVGDRSHSQTEIIYNKLEELRKQLVLVGYIPNTSSVLRDIEEEDKEDALKIHSEKLALAFGLISLQPHMPIRIVKNLRVCIDCHSMIKLVSKVVDREIIVRDNSRFHHLKEAEISQASEPTRRSMSKDVFEKVSMGAQVVDAFIMGLMESKCSTKQRPPFGGWGTKGVLFHGGLFYIDSMDFLSVPFTAA
ncbi:hypothetical protein ACLOJK_030842 [Asimina triloba]